MGGWAQREAEHQEDNAKAFLEYEQDTFERWWNSHAGPKTELAKQWAEAAWNARTWSEL